MTATPRADLIANLDIKGVTDAALEGFAQRAYETQVPELRADSAPSADRGVEVVRALVKQWVADRMEGLRADQVPRHREIEVAEAMLDGLGYTQDSNGTVRHGLRADSHYFISDLSARATTLIRPNDQVEMVRAALPVRNVPVYAEYFDKDYLTESGEAALITPGQTTGFNRVGHQLERDKGKMHWFGVATHTAWSDAFYSQAPSSVDKVVEDARIARRACERLKERVLIQGLAGIDIHGLATLAIPRINSTLNFATATLGQQAEEMTRLLQRVREATGFVGATPTVGLIDPRLANILKRKNNIDAGGSAQGAATIMQAMSDEGLTSVIEAPTMQRWFPSPRGPKFAQLVIFNPSTEGRLEQVVGMMTAPVSTAEHHGTETLYAMRIGGVDAGDMTSIAIIDIQIVS